MSVSQLSYFAEAAKQEEAEADDDMDGFQTDDEDEDDNGSDREMGIDAEDGDEVNSGKLGKLAQQVRGYNYEDLRNICMHILFKYRILGFSVCINAVLVCMFMSFNIGNPCNYNFSKFIIAIHLMFDIIHA